MARSHRLAWAAGFIDGDGFITIQNRTNTVNGKIYKGHYLRIGVCQATEVPLKELQKLFGGTIRIKNSGPNKEKYNRKTQWLWNLSTKQAADTLIQILPYLLHKKEVALLALDFQKTMSKDNKQLSDEILAYRLAVKEQIANINSES